MFDGYFRWIPTVGVLTGAALILGAIGCSPERDITYSNHTQFKVAVFSDGTEITMLEPGESKTFRIRRSQMPEHFEVFTQDGEVVFDEVVTWEILEDRNFEIVISDS